MKAFPVSQSFAGSIPGKFSILQGFLWGSLAEEQTQQAAIKLS